LFDNKIIQYNTLKIIEALKTLKKNPARKLKTQKLSKVESWQPQVIL